MNSMTQIAPYAALGQWFKKVAAELGKTPTELFVSNDGPELDPRNLVKSYTIDQGRLNAELTGDAHLSVNFDPATLTVSQVMLSTAGGTLNLWQGTMSAQQFLDGEWPPGEVYGTGEADWYSVENGQTFFAGASDDLIELNGGRGYGQEGNDTFVVWDGGVIGDYQPGEKIVFGDYESLSALAADYVGITTTDSGFTLHFAKPHGQRWDLSFENVAFSEIRMEDVAFGTRDTLVGVFQPLASAFGVDPSVIG